MFWITRKDLIELIRHEITSVEKLLRDDSARQIEALREETNKARLYDRLRFTNEVGREISSLRRDILIQRSDIDILIQLDAEHKRGHKAWFLNSCKRCVVFPFRVIAGLFRSVSGSVSFIVSPWRQRPDVPVARPPIVSRNWIPPQ